MTGVATGLRVRPGSRFPLGATWDGIGTNFSLFSQHATRVELCLFDDAGQNEQCVPLREVTPTSGMAISLASVLASAMAIGSMARGSRRPDIASTRPSSSSIRTHGR